MAYQAQSLAFSSYQSQLLAFHSCQHLYLIRFINWCGFISWPTSNHFWADISPFVSLEERGNGGGVDSSVQNERPCSWGCITMSEERTWVYLFNKGWQWDVNVTGCQEDSWFRAMLTWFHVNSVIFHMRFCTLMSSLDWGSNSCRKENQWLVMFLARRQLGKLG